MAPLKIHRWGSARSPALLCLHGFMGTGFDWDAFAREALRLNPNLCILAPDLPGHGESPPVSAGSFETQIASLLDTEKKDEVTLIGYSLGGRLGLQCLLSDPTKFSGFVGISTTAGLDISSQRDLRKSSDSQLAKKLRAISSESSFRVFLSEWWNLPVFHSPARNWDLKNSFIDSRLKQNPQALADCLDQWGSGVLPSLWDKVEAYGGRCLFLAGSADEKYAQIAKRLATTGSSTELKIINATGHQILIEEPLEAAQCVVDFLHRSNP